MLKIGEKIKDLRKKQDVTQEKLAAYLNISYQAVSKWENGTALPDLTLVPRIANFFHITADELLGMKDTEETEELKEFEKIYHENNRQGKVLDNIILSREVLSKYPRNFQWMLNLAYPLTHYEDTKEHRNYSKEHGFCEEAISICERILEDCTVDSIRHSAIQILCVQYSKKGKRKEALALAEQMPDIFLCRENLLTSIYEGEELIRQCQNNLIIAVDSIVWGIYILTLDNVMGKELLPSEKIEFFETANTILHLVYKNDEDIPACSNSLYYNYLKIAELWCEQGVTDKGIENLLLAEEAAKKYDEWANSTQIAKYKSPLVNRCISNPMGVGKNYEGSETSILLQELDNKSFDLLRDMGSFQELQESLKKALSK